MILKINGKAGNTELRAATDWLAESSIGSGTVSLVQEK
jgi:hypothetical protein